MTDEDREVMQSLLRSIEIAAEGFREVNKTVAKVVSELKAETERAQNLVRNLYATNQ